MLVSQILKYIGDYMIMLVKSKDFILKVNGKSIPAGGFVKKIFKRTILGMLSSLRGIDDVDDVHDVLIEIHYD